MIQFKDDLESGEWYELKHPPSTMKSHLKTLADAWKISVREINDSGVSIWEYHPYLTEEDKAVGRRFRGE